MDTTNDNYNMDPHSIDILKEALRFSPNNITGEIFNFLTPVYIFGFIAFQWVANYLLIKDSNV